MTKSSLHVLGGCLIATASLITFPMLSAADPGNRPVASGRILVAPVDDDSFASEEGVAKLRHVKGQVKGKIGKLGVYVIEVPPGDEHAAAAVMAGSPAMRFAEVDVLVEHAMASNDVFVGQQWHLPKIAAPTAWDSTQGAGVTIAILDTGVNGSHPDLADRMVAGWNLIDNNSITTDVHGHGTWVAGTAAATLNNATGVAGVAGRASIMPIRIADATGSAYVSTIAAGVNWAADHGAKVANASYSNLAGSGTMQTAATYMRSKGGIVVVAVGNSGMQVGAVSSGTMLVVSATDSADVLASWSCYGQAVDLAAPGVDIVTTDMGGGYASVSGTSFASPIVAGTVAMMFAANPTATPDEIDAALLSTTQDLGAAGYDMYYGTGRVDAAKAVAKMVAVVTPPPPPAPVDAIAPVVAFTSPKNGAKVNNTVAVKTSASDNLGAAGITQVLSIDGTIVATVNGAALSYSWNAKAAANGNHTLSVVARDAAGNSTTTSITVKR
jgi:thermitase